MPELFVGLTIFAIGFMPLIWLRFRTNSVPYGAPNTAAKRR